MYITAVSCVRHSPQATYVWLHRNVWDVVGYHGWMQKATNELDPNGPCQVITKERPIDERIGEYEDVNEAVKRLSQGALEDVPLYSIMEKPMTSCGCFECIWWYRAILQRCMYRQP